jgi:hypothetical protein
VRAHSPPFAVTHPEPSRQVGAERGVFMPRQLTIFFPDGRTEYWLTARVFGVDDRFDRDGTAWVVTSITPPDGRTTRTADRFSRHATITVRPDGD